MAHAIAQDYTCQLCKMVVSYDIKHECDAFQCRVCMGTGALPTGLCEGCGGKGHFRRWSKPTYES
jgi:DnaJ-class molecular chaperone